MEIQAGDWITLNGRRSSNFRLSTDLRFILFTYKHSPSHFPFESEASLIKTRGNLRQTIIMLWWVIPLDGFHPFLHLTFMKFKRKTIKKLNHKWIFLITTCGSKLAKRVNYKLKVKWNKSSFWWRSMFLLMDFGAHWVPAYTAFEFWLNRPQATCSLNEVSILALKDFTRA